MTGQESITNESDDDDDFDMFHDWNIFRYEDEEYFDQSCDNFNTTNDCEENIIVEDMTDESSDSSVEEDEVIPPKRLCR